MKRLLLVLLTICLAAIAARAQEASETPQPEGISQPVPANDGGRVAGQTMWSQMGQLRRDQKIKVQLGSGRWERCMFGGVSEESLYCVVESRDGFVQEWEIHRAKIKDFRLDHDVRNGRIAFAGCVVSAGLAIGILSYKNTHNESAGVFGGMLGAGTLGLLSGSIGSCVAGHCITLPAPPRPDFGFQYSLPLGRPKRQSQR